MNLLQYPDPSGLDNVGSSLNEMQCFCLHSTIFSMMDLPDTSELASSSPCRHVIGTRILESCSISTIMYGSTSSIGDVEASFFPCIFCVLAEISLFLYLFQLQEDYQALFSPPNYAGKCESTCFLVLLLQFFSNPHVFCGRLDNAFFDISLHRC